MREKPEVYLTFDVEGPAPREDIIEERTIFVLTTILQQLRRHGLRAIFFIPGSLSQTLSRQDEIMELLGQHEIGYHSATHSIRPMIFEVADLPKYEEAVEASLERENCEGNGIHSLRKIFPQKSIVSFRAPFMSWAPPNLEALRSLGISYDFSTSISNSPFDYRGITFFPPPLPIDGIPNIIGFWGPATVEKKRRVFQLNLLLTRILRSDCTVLSLHPARVVYKTKRHYLKKDSGKSPRSGVDAGIRLGIINLLLTELDLMRTLGNIRVTPPLRIRKNARTPAFDVDRIYAKSEYAAKKLFCYEPNFLHLHFESFFRTNHTRVSTAHDLVEDGNKVLEEILLKIERQIKKQLAMKQGYRKKVKRNIERALRTLLYRISTSSNSRVKQYHTNSSLGFDEHGRDIEDGVHKYAQLIRERGLVIHTMLVSGSRVKGSWQPASDVDMTIISSSLVERGRDPISKRLISFRRRLLLLDRPLHLGIEPSCWFSREEFLTSLKQLDIRALDAILFGQIIFDDGFWKHALEKYRNLERKYRLDLIPLKEMLRKV